MRIIVALLAACCSTTTFASDDRCEHLQHVWLHGQWLVSVEAVVVPPSTAKSDVGGGASKQGDLNRLPRWTEKRLEEQREAERWLVSHTDQFTEKGKTNKLIRVESRLKVLLGLFRDQQRTLGNDSQKIRELDGDGYGEFIAPGVHLIHSPVSSTLTLCDQERTLNDAAARKVVTTPFFAPGEARPDWVLPEDDIFLRLHFDPVTRIEPVAASGSVVVDEPNDDYYASKQAGLIEQFDVDAAWDSMQICSAEDRKVVVAVLDTGVQVHHRDLVEALLPSTSSDPKAPDGFGRFYCKGHAGLGFDNNKNCGLNLGDGGRAQRPDDPNGHGTAIAGVLAATRGNKVGIAGIGCNVQLVVVRIVTNADAARAMYYVKQLYLDGLPIHVVNCSWQDTAGDDNALKTTITELDEIALIVCAAGNTGVEMGSVKDPALIFPAAYSGQAVRNVISVAVCDTDAGRPFMATYSARYVDVAAPGIDIFTTSTYPAFDSISGSSLAAAMVSAAASLIIGEAPEKVPPLPEDIIPILCGSTISGDGWVDEDGKNLIRCGGAIDFGNLK